MGGRTYSGEHEQYETATANAMAKNGSTQNSCAIQLHCWCGVHGAAPAAAVA
jgi:hypothetical protein